MPVYEYRCLDCRRKFEVFMSYTEYGSKEIVCPHCNSKVVQRKIGRVRVGRSDHARLENMADPSNLAGLDEDPRTLGRMMREMRSEIGENMGPEFDEVVNRLEKGHTPEQIESDLPDLGNAIGGGSDAGGLDDLD